MSEVKVDTISERTTDAGVTIEGVKVEDGVATFQTAAGSPLVFEGATADAFETTFAITDPTQDNTITFPDSSFTVPSTGGMILEVLGATLDTTISTTSTSYITTGLSIDITPASTSSRFLLIVSGGEQGSNTANQEVHTTFYVDGSEVSPAGPYETSRTVNHSAYQTVYGPHSAFCLHSPSTVSEVTYAVFYKASSGTANFNVTATRVQFTVMELSS